MRLRRQVQLAIFDLDGTLLDTIDDIALALNRALSVSGLPTLPRGEVERAVGDGARTLVARAMKQANLQDFSVDPVLARFLAEYERDPTPATRPMPGALALLEALSARGVRSVVCTNKPRAIAEQVVGRVLGARVHGLIAGGDTPRLKPDRAPIDASLGGVDPRDAAMIGDGPQDIVAARAASVFSIGYLGGYGGRERLMASGPDIVVEHFDEVLAHLC